MQKWLTTMFDVGTGLDEEAIKHHGNMVPHLHPEGEEKSHPQGVNGGVGKFKRDLPVLMTEAHKGKGIKELMSYISARLEFAAGDESLKEHRKKILKNEFLQMCAEEFKSRLETMAEKDAELKKLLEDILSGKMGIYDGLKIIDKYLKFKS
jgi:hypothetical protein